MTSTKGILAATETNLLKSFGTEYFLLLLSVCGISCAIVHTSTEVDNFTALQSGFVIIRTEGVDNSGCSSWNQRGGRCPTYSRPLDASSILLDTLVSGPIRLSSSFPAVPLFPRSISLAGRDSIPCLLAPVNSSRNVVLLVSSRYWLKCILTGAAVFSS